MTTRTLAVAASLLWLLSQSGGPAADGHSPGLPTSVLPPSRPGVATLRLPPETLPARFRGHVIAARPVSLKQKVVALTFDDGPDPDVTPDVLDLLRRYHAPATFFVIGERVKRWPELVQREVRDGHAVESHSYSHPREEISAWHAWRELQRTAIVITTWAGRAPTIFRPPYGNLTDNLSKAARHEGLCVVKWTVCGSDNPRLTAAEIVEAATHEVRSGDIILLHDGRDRHQTVRALPEILRRLSDDGYRFVTVPQLLRRWDTALGRTSGTGPLAARRSAARRAG